MSDAAVMKTFSKGEYLFKEGELTTEVYILTRGGVEITVGGKPVTIIIDEGSFIGEMSVLLGKQRTATAVSITDSEFMVIEGEKISTLLQTMPNMGLKLLKDLAKRVEQTTGKLVNRERQINDFSDQPAESVPSFDEYLEKIELSEIGELLAELYKEQLFRRRPASFEIAGREYNRFKNDLDCLLENRYSTVQDMMDLAQQTDIRGQFKAKLHERYKKDLKFAQTG
jgi:CRP-like cAMP-binding protein